MTDTRLSIKVYDLMEIDFKAQKYFSRIVLNPLDEVLIFFKTFEILRIMNLLLNKFENKI